jgi:hypothetical protein
LPRELGLKVALAAASSVAALLAVEAALRIVGYAPERYAPVAQVSDRDHTTLLDCYPTNPRRYFDIDLRDPATRARYAEVAPHRLDAVVRRAPFAVESRYNTLGFRDAPLAAKRAGLTRVAIVGDSFTEGEGVKEPDTMARVLEARLAAAEPGRWEVHNAGRRGKDFPELYDVFTAALAYEPDVVVYAMVLNDAARSPEFQSRQEYLNDWILDRGRMQTRDAPPMPGLFDSRLLGFARDRWGARRIAEASTRWYVDMYGEPNREGWARTRRFITGMAEETRRRGGRFAVALWPLLVDLGPAYPFASAHDTIRRFCEAAGIPFQDLRPALAVRPAPVLWVHALDRHPNEEAHRLAAEAVLPLVRGR